MTMPAPDPIDRLTAAARAWYDAGYCVVPAHEDGSKRPFGRWKEFQHRRPAWEQVEGWLATGKYDAIGCIMGTASGNTEMIELEGPLEVALQHIGAIIAKVDTYSDPHLSDLARRLLTECVESSPNGGLHTFARITDGPALGNMKLAMDGEKVLAETRGEGGFVIVAPSPGRKGHPSGTAYAFVNDSHPDRTIEITSDDRDCLHLLFSVALTPPEEFERQAQAAEQAKRVAVATVDRPAGEVSPFDDYRERVAWADILTPAGWTWSHRDGLRDYWTRPGKAKADGISASTIEDGPMYVHTTTPVGLPVGKGLSKPDAYAYLHHAGDRAAATRALRGAGYGSEASGLPHPDLPPWTPPDPTTGEVATVEPDAASWVHEHLPRLDWHALWEADEEEEWIVQPLVPARRLVALYSVPKVGKSLLMLEIAAGVASGRPLFGYPATSPRRVLYVDFENDPRGDIKTRLQDMDYTPDDLGNLCYLSFPTMRPLDSDAGGQEVVAAAIAYGCEIVVIDTVSRAVAGEENENDTWLEFYRHTGLRLKQAGIALVRLDHAGKDESKGQRGGSAKSGDVDAVWRMSRVSDDLYRLTCEAQRFPISETELTLRRESDPLRHVVVADGYRAAISELLAAMEGKGIPKDPTMSVRAARKAAKDAGIKFRNQHLDADLWERYCGGLSAFGGTE